MTNIKRVLCLDFDDVIIKTTSIINPMIAKIEFKASSEYLEIINNKEKSGLIDDETYRILLEEHFDLKDRVLEEVDDKYQNKIDYSKIYSIENAYENVIDYINYLCLCGRYDKVYVVSHYNVSREVLYKKNFINDYMPLVHLVPIKFHSTRYQKGVNRERTNKAAYLKKYFNLRGIENYTLIDDSNSNISDWNKENGVGIQFNEHVDCVKKLHSLNPFDIMTIENDRTFKITDGRKK